MSESSLRGRVCKVLRDYGLDPVSVENSVCPGTPDVNYIGGWLELKYVREPAKTVPVQVYHFSPQQKIWLRNRWHLGGNAYLLLQCAKKYFLFNGCAAGRLLNTLTYETLEAGVHVGRYGTERWGRLEALRDLPALLATPRIEETCCGRRIVTPRE